MEDERALQVHQPCDDCGSSDALAVYADHTYCFSCGTHTKTSNLAPSHGKNTGNSNFTPVKGEFSALKHRRLTEETCRRFRYQIGEYRGQVVQIASYHVNGTIVGQKLRTASKDFIWLGGKKPGLYGQQLWKTGGKRVVVTEGEIDAMTVSQIQDHKWPVVSLPHGAAAAKRAIKDNLEWLEGFEEVVLMFDMDEPGEKAALDCCALLSPGKAKIAVLPMKDPSEMLQAGRSQEVITAIWNAKEHLPSGIVNGKDLWDELEKPITMGLSWPWDSLTGFTYGIRTGEILTLGAGTGLGKTTLFKQVAYHLLMVHKQKIGLLFLEEANSMTALSLMSIEAGRPLHVPGTAYPAYDKQKCFDKLFSEGCVYLFDHFGSTDYEEIKTRMRYLAVSCGVKYIFLDHVTALTSGNASNDERKEIDAIMTGLSSLVRELDVCLFMISHLTTPEKSAHEEGARVTIRQFRGSRSIGQWSNFVFALERDQQAEDERTRHTSTFRVLKDRYTGKATGSTFNLFFDSDSQRLIEVDDMPEEQSPFNESKGGFDDF